MPLSRGILGVRFNQDQGEMFVLSKHLESLAYKYHSAIVGCFICSMESGVQVYNVEPLAQEGKIGEKQALN